MNKTLTLAFAVAFSSVVSANDTAPVDVNKVTAMETNFKSIDANLDGVISLAEVSDKEVLQLAFDDLDLDKNGELTEDEYNKFTK